MASVLKFAVILLFLLCVCEVFECKHYRRHDVHRIVLKPKRKASYKKPPRPRPYDYHYQIQEEMFDPYHAEATHQFETMDDFQHPHMTRYREPERYKERIRYSGYKPDYQQVQFDGYKPGNLPDYRTYKEMMDLYNRKQEEDFRRQVERVKLHMQFSPHAQDMYEHAESQERPIWNAPEESGMIKGDWSPISNSDSSYHSPSYANQAYETQSTTSQTLQHIDYTKLDMTTSKPQRLPPVMTAKNSTKNDGKQKVNYNFNPNYFPNHKPGDHKENSSETKEITDKEKGNDFQPSAVVSTSYSTLWGNGQNEDENNGNKYQTNSGNYGSKTKARRTKRPAYATQQ